MKWILFCFFVLSGFAETQQVPGHSCTREGTTKEDYWYFVECLKYSSLSKECKKYTQLTQGIECARNTKQKFCSWLFSFILPDSPHSLTQLYDKMVMCAIDKSEDWENANETKVAELLAQYAQCVEPILEQFKTQYNCN